MVYREVHKKTEKNSVKHKNWRKEI